MIKFFRQIRKTLLMENKTSKYLKYAIGEIVLVVIGILIALQINNWNQDRQQRQREKKILMELKRDLVSNDNVLQNTIEMQQLIADEITALKAHLKNKEPFNDTINMYVLHAYYRESIQFTTSAYESLKSIGIDIISSDSLRADIASLFGNKIPDITKWIGDAGNEQTSEIHSYYVKFLELTTERNPIKSSLGLPEGRYIPDYDNLLKSQELINALSIRRAFKGAIIYRLERVQVYVRKTISNIDNELEHF